MTMPNVVGALRVSAVAQLQAMGLSVQVSTVPDPDRHRDHVGYVESQTPPPGTVVAPGGHATIRVYVPPPADCLRPPRQPSQAPSRADPAGRCR